MSKSRQSGMISLRLDPQLIEDLDRIAKIDNRKFNNLAKLILEKYRDRMMIDPKYESIFKNRKK